MSKVKIHSVAEKERYQIVGDFFGVVAGLKSKKEIIDFFLGLLSSSEALMLARRIRIAKLITGGAGYEEIRKKMKVSFQTINKIEQWLHGQGEEYEKWITLSIKSGTLAKNKKNKSWSDGSMLDRYAHHRLWKNLIGLG